MENVIERGDRLFVVALAYIEQAREQNLTVKEFLEVLDIAKEQALESNVS